MTERLTMEEVDLLFSGLDTLDAQRPSRGPPEFLASIVRNLAPNDEERAKFDRDLEDAKQKDAELQRRRREQVILLRAKLLRLRDASESESTVGSGEPS